jgi:type III secretory pathway lipoprotein EscJ
MTPAMGMRWLVLAVTVSACSTNILHGVDERSANEATAALERAGIGAEKLPDDGAAAGAGATYTLKVAHADGTRALDLLRALGLPHDRRRGFSETYGQPSLIPTASKNGRATSTRWRVRSNARWRAPDGS